MKIPEMRSMVHWSMLLISGCASVPSSGQQIRSCYSETALLRDTLFIGERLGVVDAVMPRPTHLAPYPPAAAGESTIQVGNDRYFAWGAPVRVYPEGDDSHKLIRAGNAGAIPLYIIQQDLAEGNHHTLWAPITEDCVFLPFKHESEMH